MTSSCKSNKNHLAPFFGSCQVWMTKCVLATGSGLAVNLWPSPTGGEGPRNVQGMARTVFWFKGQENGTRRTVGRENLTVMCAPGNSNWPCKYPLGMFLSIYFQDLCIVLNRKQSVMTDEVHFFYQSVWRILSSKETIVPGRLINECFLEEKLIFLHLSTFWNKSSRCYVV